MAKKNGENIKTVLVTGASGMIGRAVIDRLAGDPHFLLRAGVRTTAAGFPSSVEVVKIGDLGASSDLVPIMRNVDTVIHTAARVHVMRDNSGAGLALYRHSNVLGTLQLANAALAAGCRRFIFLSSIKVNGEATFPSQPFTENSIPAPCDPYGISKLEAENGLFELAARSSLEVVVIRPPLVYGPNVKANFLTMMRWLSKGVPLPLGAITKNRRSMIAIDNLVDFITTCVVHHAAANQLFLVSDAEDLSTADLLRRTAVAMGKPARLFPVPLWLLKSGAAMLGQARFMQRLCGSLQVDVTKSREILGWVPSISVDEGLRRTMISRT